MRLQEVNRLKNQMATGRAHREQISMATGRGFKDANHKARRGYIDPVRASFWGKSHNWVKERAKFNRRQSARKLLGAYDAYVMKQ